jgi:hypothetical protein
MMSRYRSLLPLLLTCLAGPVQAAFTDNGDGTVTDDVTGLMWDQCSWGQTYNAGAASGKCAGSGSSPDYNASIQNWSNALGVVVTANNQNWRGHNDWRLPNRTELVSLVNYATYTAGQPVIDGNYFPNTPTSFFWSSTVYAPDPALAWGVSFDGGNAIADAQSSVNRVRLVRSGQSFSAFDRQACGDGIPYTSGQWQMLALPCVTLANPVSAASVFGGSKDVANFDSDLYNVASTGWVLNRREVSTTPSSYVKVGKDETLTTAGGYWLKSLSAAANNKITAAGTGPVVPDTTEAQGCLTGNVCKAITVTTVTGQNRFNLVGNPFAYAIDWSKVRVRIDGSSTTYTPCQAAGLGPADGCAGTPAPTAVISNVINIWNDTNSDYDTFSDLDGSGNLKYFKSFWVNVLPAASGKTVELLIPALKSTLSQVSPAEAAPTLPWYLAWLDLLAPPARADEMATAQAKAPAVDWTVKLTLDNHVTGQKSGTVRLGQLGLAQLGYDAHDLPKLAPFAKPYLSLVFPHPEWGPQAADYATDYRPLSRRPDEWTFEVRAEPVGGVVFLSWEGDAKQLKRMRLIDQQTGKTIQPAAKKWTRKGYPITLNNPVQRYTWRYLGK